MINLNFILSNPWSKEKFNIVFAKNGMLNKYKAWEIQIINQSAILATLAIDYNIKRDHAGLTTELGLFGFIIIATIYDTRHWDDTLDTWIAE